MATDRQTLKEWGRLVRQHRSDVGRTLESVAADLARELGERITYQAVRKWEAGEAEPAPDRVFAIERVLGVPAGKLSSSLGYVPADSRAARSVTEAIELDRSLTGAQRQALRASYEAFRRS